MKLAATIGITLSEFWEMTLDELNLYAEIYFEKQKNAFKEKVTLEYWNAMWTIQWLGRKNQQPKPLNTILENMYEEKKVMSDLEMLEQVKLLNKMFGGTEIIVNS